MNVERIQKINNLALDLMKQGLAADRDEAIAQAEKIFSSTDNEAYTSMKETLQKVNSNTHHKQDINDNDSINQIQKAELSQSKIEEILDKNTIFLVKTIKNFQEKIDLLEKELSVVKNKINYTKLPTVRDIVSKPTEEKVVEPNKLEKNPSEVTTKENSQSTKEVKESNESHPRVGNYNDTDVSIEKFFYMGSK